MKIIHSHDDIPNDQLSQLYLRWDTMRDGAGVPRSRLLNKEVLGDVSAYCKLAEIQQGNVKYVSVGQALKDLYPEKIEGAYLHDLFEPWIRKQVIKTYEKCLEEKAAIYERKGFSTIVGSIGYEYLLLPFTHDDTGEVHAIVSCLFPQGSDIQKYLDWEEAISLTPWLSASK